MKKSNWMKGMRWITLTGFLVLLSAFRSDEVITGDLAFLVGEYDFICSFNRDVKTEAAAIPDKYSLKITKKDEMIFYKNGKKVDKYHFSSVRLDVLDDHRYVMFYKKDQYYPLFYKGDTVVMHLLPTEFDDNYFVKRGH
jgi:hypothetical protein